MFEHNKKRIRCQGVNTIVIVPKLMELWLFWGQMAKIVAQWAVFFVTKFVTILILFLYRSTRRYQIGLRGSLLTYGQSGKMTMMFIFSLIAQYFLMVLTSKWPEVQKVKNEEPLRKGAKMVGSILPRYEQLGSDNAAWASQNTWMWCC
jgi:hypothetical protein